MLDTFVTSTSFIYNTREPKMEQERIMTSDFLLSKTAPTGKITYCNEEFIKISGYTEEELLGKPHNIVRHPDMPRTLFKYLWQKIRNGEEVNAYVKNRAKDGPYYWVFANIAPSFANDGKTIVSYNSVRRKPHRDGIAFITDFYAKLRQAEQAGLDHGLQWFNDQFASLNLRYENAILQLQEKGTLK